MLNLIKNEFIKIFSKKSIYVIIFLLLLFVLFTNIIYKYKMDDYGNFKENNYNETNIEKLNKEMKKEKNLAKKKSLNNEILTNQLILKYGVDSWQAYIVTNKMNDILNEENNIMLNKIIERFNNNNWKIFVKEDLEELKNNINEDNDTYELLKIDKEILEIRLKNNISYKNNYLNTELENYGNYKKIMLNRSNNKYDNYLNKSNLLISKYIIDNKINSNKVSDTRGILKNFFVEYELIIIFFILMISGVIVEQEFNKGTIKQLLILPYSRRKILLSKYISSILMILFVICIIIIFEVIIGGIFFGFNSLNVPVVVYNFNKEALLEYNIFYYLFKLILAKIPMLILINTIVFFLGVLSLNATLSIALTSLLYMFSNLFNTLAIDSKVLSYLITPNWDFSQYLNRMISINPNININISISLYIIYLILFILISFHLFEKKEIKNI